MKSKRKIYQPRNGGKESKVKFLEIYDQDGQKRSKQKKYLKEGLPRIGLKEEVCYERNNFL